MAARLERDQAPSPRSLGRAEVEAMLDYLGDVGAALGRATPERLAELYGSLGLELIFHPDEREVDVAIQPRRGSERVRGGLGHDFVANLHQAGVHAKKCSRIARKRASS